MTTLTPCTVENTAPVARLAPISLDELNALAALQERVDRKYVLTQDRLAPMIEALTGRLAVLEIDHRRSFGYESVYFDTATFESYLGAAHRRRRRFKVRTRSYIDAQTTMLEVKTKATRGRTTKRRQPHDFDLRQHLGNDGRAFVDLATGHPGLGDLLLPTLTSHYRRTTLVDLDDVARLTIDSDLYCTDWAFDVVKLAGRVVVETKSAGAPSAADRWLWSHGIRPVKISKFATCLAALHPELPSNKWSRTLSRHFG